MIEPTYIAPEPPAYENYLALMKEADKTRKQQAIETLKAVAATGITRINISFSGGGDEGDINDINYYIGKETTDEPDIAGLKEAAHSMLDEFVTIDWWNNEGGGGDLAIDLTDFTATSDVYYMDTISVPTGIHDLNTILSQP
jgi:hypothetical protein